MKRKFKIVDNINKVVVEKQVSIRDKEYFNTLLANKNKIHKDKTRYNRKEKYKKGDYEL